MKQYILMIMAITLFACGGGDGSSSNNTPSGNTSASSLPDFSGTYGCVANCDQSNCYMNDEFEIFQSGDEFVVDSNDGEFATGSMGSDGNYAMTGDGVFCTGKYNESTGKATANCSFDGVKCEKTFTISSK